MVYHTNFIQPTALVAGLIAVAATTLGTYFYICNKFRRYKLPSEWKAVGEVRKLCIYPLKGGRRLEVDRAECVKQGLMEAEKFDKSLRLRDRSFLVYQEENQERVSAGRYPKMILVEIKSEHMNHVLLNAPNMNTLLLRIPDQIPDREVIVKCGRNEEYFTDCGGEAATWISQYILGKYSGLRIAFYDGNDKNDQFNQFELKTSETYPIYIINQASLADINKGMDNSNITPDYFRPNLVIDGLHLKPYEEDQWKWIKVGDVVMKNMKKCVRCMTTTINPETGIKREDKEPLTTMRTFRATKALEEAPAMGILLEIYHPGTISVGDILYVAS